MWLLLTFDVPMETAEQRREYRRLVKRLGRYGFQRIQLSVFARFVSGEEHARRIEFFLRDRCPPEGEIRILRITDAQYQSQVVLRGGRRAEPESQPDQYVLFG
ncbi:MAG: CRISPR-associated endonuclease Cas2 [Fimbriimonadaceae bacterium]